MIGTAPDYVIEQFWKISETEKVWDHIAELNFEFATSLTYSVWEMQPRFDQIYNQERNLLTHDYLLERGVISLPFLFFHDRKDYDETIAWLRDRPEIRTVTILAQFYESLSEFEYLLRDMRALQEDAQRPFQFMIVGASTAEKIELVLSEFGDATIVTHQPLYKALYWQRTLPDLEHIRVIGKASQGRLAVENVKHFQTYCSEPRLWGRAA